MHPSGCKHGSRKPLADARICRLSIAGVGRSGSPAGDRDARTLRRFAREVRHRRYSPIGARIWFALSGILVALAGGYTAGRLAGAPKESTAGWRGLTTWALTTLVIYEVCGISLGKVRAHDQRVRGQRAALIGLSTHDSSIPSSCPRACSAGRAASQSRPGRKSPIASATGGHDGGA